MANPISTLAGCEASVDQNPYSQFNVAGFYRVCDQADGRSGYEIPRPRKRVREDYCCSSWSPSPDVNIAVKMQKEVDEMDLFVHLQTERIRAEVKEKARKHWMSILRGAEEGMRRILSAKEEETAAMMRRNSALEEKVRILETVGRRWRSAAQKNEAAAAALRRDLEAAEAREGSGENGGGEMEEETAAWRRETRSRCRNCGSEEASVLVLPCRHLCLCSDCDPRLAACPLCMSPKTASIRIQLL